MKKTIVLGNKVRDIVSGFEGIATAKVDFLNGCTQICVRPKSQDGKMPEGEYIDINQLEYVDEGVVVSTSDNGGQRSDIPKRVGLSRK